MKLQLSTFKRKVDGDEFSEAEAAESVIPQEIPDGPELLRILKLDRRDIPDPDGPEAIRLAAFLTSKLARKPSPYPGALMPTQALVLREALVFKGGFFPVVVGGGKAQPNSEPVLLDRGWVDMGSVVPGDRIYGRDGQLHDVLAVLPQGRREVFKLTLSDGTTTRSDGEHLWSFMLHDTGRPEQTRTLNEWRKERLFRKTGAGKAWRLWVPMCAPVQYPEAVLPIDPYTLGLLLGDGSFATGSPSFCGIDGLEGSLVLPEGVGLSGAGANRTGCPSWYLTAGRAGQVKPGGNPLTAALRDLGLHNTGCRTKFVPDLYLRASVDQRLSVLQGLMDTDGYVNKSACEITLAGRPLIDCVGALVESLGGTCTINEKVIDGEVYFRAYIRMRPGLCPFRLKRKVDKYQGATAQHGPVRSVRAIESDGYEDSTCLVVSSPDSLYLTAHHIVTHNCLTSFLVASLFMSKGYSRVIYVCPGANVPDAEREFAKFRESWYGPTEASLPIVSYEDISTKGNAEVLAADGSVIRHALLFRKKPQVIIIDECHRVSDPSSATTRRFKHYIEANPDTIVVALSGTPFKTSVLDAAHITEWTLGERSPVPRPGVSFTESKAWSGYLDAGRCRTQVGELVQLSDQYASTPDIYTTDPERLASNLQEMRQVVGRRLLETPGVIGTRDAPLDIPITLEPLEAPTKSAAIGRACDDLVETGALPDGTQMTDDLSQNRHMSTLSLGFYQKYEPPPPDEWRLARNEWAKWCRRALKYNKKRITSEATLKDAIRRGLFPKGVDFLDAWEEAQINYTTATGLPEPPSVTQWVDFSELKEGIGAWLSEHTGLIWVNHIGLGERIALEFGLPYYGAGGGYDAKSGRNILDHQGGSAVASIAACGTGKSLQYLWSKNLWLTTPGEQSLARTHRKGQPAPVVRNFLWIGSSLHLRSVLRARDAKAGFAEALLLSPQKLRYAQSTLPDIREIEGRRGARWTISAPDQEEP